MVAQALRDAQVATPLRDFGIPARFLDHAKRAEVLAEIGLTAQDISREIIETVAQLDGALDQPGQHTRTVRPHVTFVPDERPSCPDTPGVSGRKVAASAQRYGGSAVENGAQVR